MKVGFVGLGSMGFGQAMLLAESEHETTVFDVSPKASARFEGKAEIAASLDELGQDKDVVGVCVRDDAQVNECADALIPVMSEGSVLMIHSTVKPGVMIALAERAAERKIRVLDAAVTRTVMEQDKPFVFCMCAGDENDYSRVKPVMDAYATDTIYVGPQGSAMAMKISNNLVSWCQIMLGLEAFGLAEAAGVPTDKLLNVMSKNGVLTPPMKGMIQLRGRMDQQDARELVLSQSGIGEKDLTLAEALGRDADVETPIGTFIRTTIKAKLDSMAGDGSA